MLGTQERGDNPSRFGVSLVAVRPSTGGGGAGFRTPVSAKLRLTELRSSSPKGYWGSGGIEPLSQAVRLRITNMLSTRTRTNLFVLIEEIFLQVKSEIDTTRLHQPGVDGGGGPPRSPLSISQDLRAREASLAGTLSFARKLLLLGSADLVPDDGELSEAIRFVKAKKR